MSRAHFSEAFGIMRFSNDGKYVIIEFIVQFY